MAKKVDEDKMAQRAKRSYNPRTKKFDKFSGMPVNPITADAAERRAMARRAAVSRRMKEGERRMKEGER